MVRIEDIADRLGGGLLDGGNDVPRLLGKIGVKDDHEVLEHDPDVVAAAESDRLVRGTDRGVAKVNAGSDLTHLIKLHSGQGFAGPQRGAKTEKANQQP